MPGKIKQFLWQACTNSLPTLENLWKRKILEEAEFSHCAGAVESAAHALWSCNCLKTVWDTDFGWVDRSAENTDSFSDVLQKIRAKPASVSLFAVTFGLSGIKGTRLISAITLCHSATLLALLRIISTNSEVRTDPLFSGTGLLLAGGFLRQPVRLRLIMMELCLVNQIRQAYVW